MIFNYLLGLFQCSSTDEIQLMKSFPEPRFTISDGWEEEISFQVCYEDNPPKVIICSHQATEGTGES